MTKQQLASKIWAAANNMRSKIEASEYKDYILGFIFYKYLSEKEVSYLKGEGATDEDIKELTEEDTIVVLSTQRAIGYFIDYDNLFSTWIEKGADFTVSDVTKALSAFDRLIHPNHMRVYNRIFSALQVGLEKLGTDSKSRTKAIRDLIELIKIIPMDNKQGYDILGFIYEYLIGNFAATAGKKAGEFYTPHEVSVLMSEIVAYHLRDCSEIKIFDPTSGSGSLLINIAQSIAKHMTDKNRIKYYAQELIENTYNLTRMNLIMRGILPDNIVTRCGDTLEDDWPYFDDSDRENTYDPLTNLDAVVSNPPYSQKWNPKDKQFDPRFNNYGVAPKAKADYAFLLHDLYHIKKGGIVTIVLPHGVLFRGGEEGKIRKNLIENNNIDAIIGLPANIFFGTGIPTLIMVLKKGREEDDVLIIDASKGFVKDGKSNKLRSRDIKKIADTYMDRLEIEKYSRRVSRDEIRNNDYNLNIPRYVDSSEKTESFDIYATMFGGIPLNEIDELSREFEVFPSLKEQLFADSVTPYVTVKVEDVKKTVLNNEEVLMFKKQFCKNFDDFAMFMKEELINRVDSVVIAKEEKVITDEINKRLLNVPLIDKYEAYQLLDDKWQAIALDLEAIQNDGFDVVRMVDPNNVLKKKDGKEVEVQEGWVGRVLPFEIVQQNCQAEELCKIRELNDELSSISSEYEEILDSISEEDRGVYVNEEGDAFVAKEITKLAKEYKKAKEKPEKDSVDEKLLHVGDLNTKEKEIKKVIKTQEFALQEQTIKIINSLSDNDAKELLVHKWITPFISDLNALPDSIVSEFEKKIVALTKKYSVTMVDIDSQIRDSERELSSMLDDLVGDEYDMEGLKKFKKLLGGE